MGAKSGIMDFRFKGSLMQLGTLQGKPTALWSTCHMTNPMQLLWALWPWSAVFGAFTLLHLFLWMQECPLAWQPVQHRHAAAVLAHQPRDTGHCAATECWRCPRRQTATIQFPAFKEEQAVGSGLL